MALLIQLNLGSCLWVLHFTSDTGFSEVILAGLRACHTRTGVGAGSRHSVDSTVKKEVKTAMYRQAAFQLHTPVPLRASRRTHSTAGAETACLPARVRDATLKLRLLFSLGLRLPNRRATLCSDTIQKNSAELQQRHLASPGRHSKPKKLQKGFAGATRLPAH